ncbi:MAG: ribosome assembly RNA-binding protein YhbY [endosymbiont of Galathealinum brachiosum]|uniref:Ribosome assembly RNA-binding protein YhbY n=1 Tax=endosymbiont of Galathealinum brachiosum TaxID=2200906 RepID=A0A370D8I1_9GAMM|nr:MAG: ribosome assembly RNA-binding protein YhbY [endosymbiont of Galathealinum brachiosum]
MPLLKHQLKHLKTLTHNLKPVIMIGQNGVTDNILKELEIALDFHELVKIKIAGENKASCASVIEQLINTSSAETVQKIGKTLTLYRRNREKPKIELPKK